MRRLGRVQWEVEPLQETELPQGIDTFQSFLDYCVTKFPIQDIIKSFDEFLRDKEHLHSEVKKTIQVLSRQPFLAIFLAWVKEVAAMRPELLTPAKMLLENGFIGIFHQKNEIWTLNHAKVFDHSNVLAAIRCHVEWSLSLREKLVSTYIAFMHWLWNITFGYINKLEDPDLIKCQGRLVNYSLFITFLTKLNPKEQLVAKLLYFGGSRTLEDVLSLQIEDIDFENDIINFGSQKIAYPLHIFADIQGLLNTRKSGLLFVNKSNVPLNPATIFRNFKKAAIEVGYDSSFTPKHLTTNG